MKVIHLQTQRVVGTDLDGESRVEQKTVQLEDGKTFENFVDKLKANGYRCKGDNRPKVTSVIEMATVITKKKDDLDQVKESCEVKTKELTGEIEKYQAIVDAVLKPTASDNAKGEDIESLKAANEKLTAEMAEIKAMLSKGKGDEEQPIKDDGDKDVIIAEIIDRGGKADKRMGMEKLTSVLEELKSE